MFEKVYPWLKALLVKETKPFLLGINGPQGCGKSTLSSKICEKLAQDSIRSVAISIDDFYLSRMEQIRLGAQYGDNPYLKLRGYPGTHDIPAGTETLKSLKAGKSTLIPRYDKSAHQGKGDQLPKDKWQRIEEPVKLIILEGWMLGFTPVGEKALPNPNFKPVNKFLAHYRAWHELLDGFLQLEPDDYKHVLQWRVEAEEKMKASGKPGMTTEAVTSYIELFLPAYQTYLPVLKTNRPKVRADLTVTIGRNRG